MRRVLCALLVLVGLVPATLHAAPAPTYASLDTRTDLARSYFGGRYYAGGNGRFTTVDPVLDIDQALVDPQRWNRYTYVRNNPFRYVDPDGRAIETLWDVISLGMSLQAVRQDPTSVWNWVSLGADVVSVVGPGIPAIGMAIRGVSKVDDAIDITHRAAALDDLSRAAAQADRNGLTKVGRALQKHGNDPAGSMFRRVAGHKALNEMGQTIVDDILTAPGAKTSIVKTRRYGNAIEVRAPDGRGLRYDEYGNLMGFLEP